ncbi:chondroitinase family polysaccharide lyase [Carboxylicivirga sp. M1479]|uniref:chondroitinase family polysaccharide lyase n=1 Tax=Carboxylicivirga sp. M1479 TaxID=2594476 RepID=UPI0011789337|nr:chondroitinase family polysaccharide lyase [Carboxylicivirga sp. M1479]TRX66413.1 lyase [Carboxylicivirga sp. M1479]
MNKLLSITLLLLFVSFTTKAIEKGKIKIKEDIVIHKIGFEQAAEYSNWSTKKGKLQVSDLHQKQGRHSLLWTWKKGDVLSIDQLKGLKKAASKNVGGQPENYEPAFYKEDYYGGIKMWIYQQEAAKGQMLFQVGSDVKSAKENPKYRFAINLNFTGWRAVWVQFNEDAKVSDYIGSDSMTSIIAQPQAGASQGQLYIDHFQLLEFISYKRHSDHVFVNAKANVRSDSYEILAPYKEYEQFLNTSSSQTSSVDLSQAIEERLEYMIIGGDDTEWRNHAIDLKKESARQTKKANSAYNTLQLHSKNGIVNGIPLFTCRDEHGTSNGQNFQTVMQSTLFPLALDYRMNKTIESKEKLVNLYNYFADQGWQAGSALGTVDHIIRLNAYAVSLFLMRNDLPQEMLQQHQECLAWHTRIGNIIDCDKSKGENTDMVRGGALAKLITVLLMPNGQQKAQMLNEFKVYMDYVAAFAPGYSDTVKPDYSIFHHRGTYLNAYGVSAVNTMAMVSWLLNNTDFALSADTKELIKKTLIRQYEIAHGLDLHMGVGGRFPYKNTGIDRFMLPAYAFMSLNDKNIEDQHMAAVFNYLYSISPQENVKGILTPALTYSGTYGTINLMVGLNSQMGDETQLPNNGNYSLPYSSLSVHRHDNWLATVKGYDKYVWDYETGSKGENNLGRYLSHGAMFLFKSSPLSGMKGAGMEQNSGFHWAYLPGATTKALPIDKVYFKNKPSEKYKEGFHRSFTETTFARGLSAQGNNGLFAMELRDDVHPSPDKHLFDNSFRARKSYFFFDDEIVCLGSDISNIDDEYTTITTLFQTNIGEHGIQNKATYLNGQAIANSLDLKQNLKGGVLTDVQGIHYIIPQKYNVVLEQNEQQSLQKIGGGKYVPITTPHVKAWFNHGLKPQGKGYEYLVLMNDDMDKAISRHNDKGYKVLQKDASAHIVKHINSKATGYAIFNADAPLNKGIIVSVDTPLMVYVKQNNHNAVLTVANPDLKLKKWNHNMSVMPSDIVHEWSQGSIVNIKLNGHWKPAAYSYELVSYSYANGVTQLSFYCKDGKSIDLPLRKQ